MEILNQMGPMILADLQAHPNILQPTIYSLLHALVIHQLASSKTVNTGSKELNSQIKAKMICIPIIIIIALIIQLQENDYPAFDNSLEDLTTELELGIKGLRFFEALIMCLHAGDAPLRIWVFLSK